MEQKAFKDLIKNKTIDKEKIVENLQKIIYDHIHLKINLTNKQVSEVLKLRDKAKLGEC